MQWSKLDLLSVHIEDSPWLGVMGCSFDEPDALKFLASGKIRSKLIFCLHETFGQTAPRAGIFTSQSPFFPIVIERRLNEAPSLLWWWGGGGRGEQCTPPFYGLVRPGCAQGFWTFLACIAWQFWLSVPSNKGGWGQRSLKALPLVCTRLRTFLQLRAQ